MVGKAQLALGRWVEPSQVLFLPFACMTPASARRAESDLAKHEIGDRVALADLEAAGLAIGGGRG